MEIKIKFADGVLKVGANAVNTFKQYVLKDEFVRQASMAELLDYRLYGLIHKNGGAYVGELIVSRDNDGNYHVYEAIVDGLSSKLIEVSFDGNDTLFTSCAEALTYRDRLHDPYAEIDRARKRMEEAAPKTGKYDDKKVVTVPDSYKDIISTILSVVSQMQDGKETIEVPGSKPAETPQAPVVEHPKMKVPSVPTKNTIEHMSLADKVRLEHMQQCLANCQKNIEDIQKSIQEKRKELDLWIEEANHYVDQAELIVKQHKQ